MNPPYFRDSFLRDVQESFVDNTLRQLRQLENVRAEATLSRERDAVKMIEEMRHQALLTREHDAAKLLDHVRDTNKIKALALSNFHDAFTLRYDTSLRDIAAAAQLFTPRDVLADAAHRGLTALASDPMRNFLRSVEETALAAPLLELKRAVADLTAAMPWEVDEARSAATIEAVADLVESEPVPEISNSGRVIVDEIEIDEPTAAEAVAEAVRAVKAATPEAATQKDIDAAVATVIAHMDRRFAEQKPSGVKQLIHAILLPLMISSAVADLQTRGAFDYAKPSRPATPVVASLSTSATPRLYRVKADRLSLRAEPSTESRVRVTLEHDERVIAVEQNEDGWLLVKSRIEGQSHIEGWVARVHVEPVL
ncbi:MAG TPA: SH3 domain-containing protein [Thermoanaerobaculia bacterium]|jgi:hypothetical protein|nr:SH3 domain-containing protein [Thermoanaerobaculia bacterium]